MGAKKIATWTVAVIVFAAVGWHLIRSRGSPSSSEIPLPIRDERAVSSISEPEGKPSAALSGATPPEGSNMPGVSSRAFVSVATPQTDSARPFETPNAALQKTEHAFDAEQTDPLWSQGMETRILSQIAQIPGLEVLTVQVRCRTSMCRIELTEPGQLEPGRLLPANAAFGRLVLGLDHQPLWIMSLVDRYGTPTSLAYLARDHLDAPVANIQ